MLTKVQKWGDSLALRIPAAVVILSDQVKSLDWKARKAKFACKLPSLQFNEVIRKLRTLVREQP